MSQLASLAEATRHTHTITKTNTWSVCYICMCLCYSSITPSLYEWGGWEVRFRHHLTCRALFPLLCATLEVPEKLRCSFVFITSLPPCVSTLYTAIYVNKSKIINRLCYISATLPFPCGRAWCSHCSRDDSLCTGPTEQGRGVCVCVCVCVQTCTPYASACARVMVQHSPLWQVWV